MFQPKAYIRRIVEQKKQNGIQRRLKRADLLFQPKAYKKDSRIKETEWDRLEGDEKVM